MKQEKELLLKDLCARLPYGVKCRTLKKHGIIRIKDCVLDCHWLTEVQNDFYTIKPYLFPLSSMTEEQYEKFKIISGWDGDIEDIRRGKFSCIGYIGLDYIYDTIDWFNKNHFDYRGLIEKGLAYNATNLGIYKKADE